MLREIDYTSELSTSSTIYHECDMRIRACAHEMAERLQRNNPFLLDVDGVICLADSLSYPQPTTRSILPILRSLERKGAHIGLATARSFPIMDFLREEHKLNLIGPSILESGHLLTQNCHTEHIVSPSHASFIQDTRQAFKLADFYKNSWDDVKRAYDHDQKHALCMGNIQWQGTYRASWWFRSAGTIEADRQLYSHVFEPVIDEVAQQNGISLENNLIVSVSRMLVGDIAILSIKGKLNGNPVSKNIAANRIHGSWIFVADGYDDIPLARLTKERGGLVIGIASNLDDSTESIEFLRCSDFVFRSPEEFVASLAFTARLLQKS